MLTYSDKICKGMFLSIFICVLYQSALADWPSSTDENLPLSTFRQTGPASEQQIYDLGDGNHLVLWLGHGDIYGQKINSAGEIQWATGGVTLWSGESNLIDYGYQDTQVIPDGYGGGIVAWGEYGIRVQRVNANGIIQWATDGITISNISGHLPELISDGSGGAVVVWEQTESGYMGSSYSILLAQRIDSDGNLLWAAEGVDVGYVGTSGWYGDHKIISDGSGGAIISWPKEGYSGQEIYAQRVDSSGDVKWSPEGVEVCGATGNHDTPQLVSDHAGGAIITWEDRRSSPSKLYAQRINADGIVQWTPDGVEVSSLEGTKPKIVSNSPGESIIVWEDGKIHAQRLDPSGIVQWTTDGIQINAVVGLWELPDVISDGSGGATICWADSRSGNDLDIYAQNVDSNGVEQWTSGGKPVCDATGLQSSPHLVQDCSGGTVILWLDGRYGFSYATDIFAQRVNSSGTAQWDTNGNGFDIWHSAVNPQCTLDGFGNVITAWVEQRGETGLDIYAQKVTLNGEVMWATGGVSICNASYDQANVQLIADGSGGVILAWEDMRNGNDSDIYAQRVDASGAVSWATASVPVCATPSNQEAPRLISDCSGGAIIAWQDHREFYSGSFSSDDNIFAQHVDLSGSIKWATNGLFIKDYVYDVPQVVSDGDRGAIFVYENFLRNIYAQRYDTNGIVLWATDGVVVCSADDYLRDPIIVSDGSGGAIVVWEDCPSGSMHTTIYAQRLNSAGIIQWTTDGVQMSPTIYCLVNLKLISDGNGGGIIAWDDYWGGTPGSRVDNNGFLQWSNVDMLSLYRPDYNLVMDGSGGAVITATNWDHEVNVDLHAQRVSSLGERYWGYTGYDYVTVCSAPNKQIAPQLVPDGSGGAVIVWQDSRNDSGDIYAQRLYNHGEIGLFPSRPSNPGTANIATDSITWTWDDNSDNEEGFNLYAGPGPSAPTIVSATVIPDSTNWLYSSLTANASYSFQVASYNAEGESPKTSNWNRYTLATSPSVGDTIVCNKSTGVLYPKGTVFTFSNPAGFGTGTHGGPDNQISEYKYVWNTDALYTFGGGYSWTSGTRGFSPSVSGDYYIHLQSYNGSDVANSTTVDYGPFEIDADEPISSATTPLTKVEGSIDGTYNASDTGGGGLVSVSLYVREPGLPWADAGTVTGGVFSFSPTQAGSDADGIYCFQTVAEDGVGNSESIPSGTAGLGDSQTIYNNLSNTSLSLDVPGVGSYTFPMENGVNVRIMFGAVAASPGIVTVTRIESLGGVVPPTYQAGSLIDEKLAISTSASGIFDATIEWDYQINNGLAAGEINKALRDNAGAVTELTGVSSDGTTITIPGVTAFSDWYAGSVLLPVDDWKRY